MIASEEDGTLEALRFSLASDIVELVVLTGDDIFLQTLREAVGSARRLWHVPSADKVSDLLVAGQVGILVLDVQTLREASPAMFIVQIKRQFPDLVVVVAGHRDSETWLAPLISAGTVYRFIHKPMSPGRAKSFADAAVKKFSEQRRRAVVAPAIRSRKRRPRRRGWLLAGGGILVLAAAVIAMSLLGTVRRSAPVDAGPATPAAVSRAAAAEAALLNHADAALAANRLTEPAGDNALELYNQAAAADPNNAAARAGVAEVHERLLARAERALAQAEVRRPNELKTGQPRVTPPVDPVAQSTSTTDRQSIEPVGGGIASAANVDAPADLSATARQQAGADSAAQLLKNANDRLQQGRLVEPVNDSAKYFLLTLHSLDPNYPGLAPALSDLGTRLVAKARHALTLEQYDAARSALEEAGFIGFASAEATEVRQELDAAAAKQRFYSNVVAANDLTTVKTVQPAYPQKARAAATEGWVELDFTVTESGFVRDIAVHAASTPGVFEQAAIAALAQWHYKPILRDSQPVPQRARVRIRFTLAG